MPEPVTVNDAVLTELFDCSVFVTVSAVTINLLPIVKVRVTSPSSEIFSILPLTLLVAMILLLVVSLVTER